MKAGLNDKVCYDGDTHIVLRVHTLYELDGICVPVEEKDIFLVESVADTGVVAALCAAINLPIAAYKAQCRIDLLPLKRQAIWAYLRNRYHWTFARISMASNRAHCTILDGVRHYTDLLDAGDSDAIELQSILDTL